MKDKIDKKLADERTKRVQPKSDLPKVNKDLFLKLKDHESGGVAKKKQREVASNLLADDRFSAMFTDDRYQVDQNDEAFRYYSNISCIFIVNNMNIKISPVVMEFLLVVHFLQNTLLLGTVHKRRHQSRGGVCQKMILLNKLI